MEDTGIQVQITIQPLTDEQVRERLAASEDARALRREMLARRGGKPFPPSWPIIRAAREERSSRL
jgi:hypothetical protein